MPKQQQTPKQPKQRKQRKQSKAKPKSAARYWPGGRGGGGSTRGAGCGVVKPHARTTPTCARCSRFHTTEEHDRHARGGRPPARQRRAEDARAAPPRRSKPKVAPATTRMTTAKLTRDPESRRRLAAAIAEAVAAVGPEGRYGPENVFISEVWKKLRPTTSLTETEFKRALVDLNREQLLQLERADLVSDMDPRKVEASEISDLGANFHFLTDASVRRRTAPVPRRGPASIPELADAVAGAVRTVGRDGRFGPHKVFISEVWKKVAPEARMTREEFQRALLEMNRLGLVRLARADLVAAMDRNQVAASEILDRGTSFHFVLDQSAIGY